MLCLDPRALENYLPHRGVNLMVDEVAIAEGGQQSTMRTVVPDGDVRGRGILARRDGNGRRVWYEPFLGEALALTGVALLHEQLAPKGLVGVFSAISRAEFTGTARQDLPVQGEADIKRSRSDFWQFGCRFSQEGKTVFVAEIMAGAAPLAEIASAAPRPGQMPPGEAPQADFSWKDARLRFIDRVLECRADGAGGQLRGWYAYPTDHPFVATHFPGAALMMGVTQWAVIADAAWEASVRLGLGPRVQASGTITRPDGTEVVDVRELVLDASDGVPAIRSTKRVAFREPVRPGDALVITIQVQPC